MKAFFLFLWFLIVLIGGPMWSGYVLSVMWAWFVVPLFHLPPLQVACQMGKDGAMYRHLLSEVTVIESVAKEQDHRRWLHVSLAHPRRLPTWEEVKMVKSIWIGDDKDAFQVLPRQSKYVNIHPFCLHLYHCLDAIPLPDFTRGGKTI